MKLLQSVLVPLVSLGASALAASSWTFDEATLSIQGKGSGVGGGVKETYVEYTQMKPDKRLEKILTE